MKKTSYFLLSLLATSMVALSVNGTKKVLKVNADTPLETYIEMSEGAFTDYTDAKGSFAEKDAKFWTEGYSFNALDTFFRGETKEGWTGTLTTRTWEQQTQYIYFTWGAANNKLVDSVLKMKLVIHCGSFRYEMSNDTFVGNPMVLRYFKVPDADYVTFNGDRFNIHIELVDGLDGDFGFHNFGYLHVNQSEEQVSDAMRYYINHMGDGKRFTDNETRRNWEIAKRKEIYDYYFSNTDLKKVFLRTVTNINDGFDDNREFLNHWYIDPYYDNNVPIETYVDQVIDFASARDPEGSAMPFNKSVSGFFRGWHDERGYEASDAGIYRFISRPFVLNEKGIVSIKMAGRGASLHVIDSTNQSDLAWIDVRSYNGDGDENNIALSGKNTVTMVRHIINLEEFAGRTIQLALADVHDHDWAAAYFDELRVNPLAYPTFNVDVVRQTNSTGTFYAVLTDKYVCSTHIDNDSNGVKYVATKDVVTRVDTTSIYEAYKFVDFFYNNVRKTLNFNSICSISDDLVEELKTKYNALGNSARGIVNYSEDYDRGRDYTGNWYEKAVNNDRYIEETVAYLISGAYKNVLYHGPVTLDVSNGFIAIIAIALTTMLVTLVGVALIRKKKSK